MYHCLSGAASPAAGSLCHLVRWSRWPCGRQVSRNALFDHRLLCRGIPRMSKPRRTIEISPLWPYWCPHFCTKSGRAELFPEAAEWRVAPDLSINIW